MNAFLISSWLMVLTTSPADPSDILDLKVLTFNTWSLPVVSPDRVARLEAAIHAIGELEPDVIGFQEVWMEEDATRLAEGLRAYGLNHHHRPTTNGPFGSGLLIVSKYPLSDPSFVAFREGAYPHIPWHVDWVAQKGVAVVRVEAPEAAFWFANTHLQSTYGTNDYLAVQLSQVLQMRRTLEPYRDHPLIVAGDLNSGHRALPFRLLSLTGQLTPTDPKCGIDTVLLRGSAAQRVETVKVERDLEGEYSDGRDYRGRLSDHPGILVSLRIRPGASTPPMAFGLPQVTQKALSAVWQSAGVLDVTAFENGLSSAGCASLALALCLLGLRWRRPRLRRSRLLSFLAFAGLGACMWFAYLGLHHAQAHRRNLSSLTRVLGKMSRGDELPLSSRSGLATPRTEMAPSSLFSRLGESD